MQLYIFPPSPNSLRVQAVANQLDLELELVPVDLPGGGQMKPEFIRLNPNHKIPVLVDDDFVVWESNAIMLYLAHMKPESGLVPEDVKERVKMAQWLFWNNSHFGPACGIFMFENLLKKLLNLGDPNPEQLKKGKVEFSRFIKVLDDHLQGREYIAGKTVTLADHTVVSWLVHSKAAGLPMEGYDEVKRWSAALFDSDAWQKALQVIPVQ